MLAVVLALSSLYLIVKPDPDNAWPQGRIVLDLVIADGDWTDDVRQHQADEGHATHRPDCQTAAPQRGPVGVGGCNQPQK